MFILKGKIPVPASPSEAWCWINSLEGVRETTIRMDSFKNAGGVASTALLFNVETGQFDVAAVLKIAIDCEEKNNLFESNAKAFSGETCEEALEVYERIRDSLENLFSPEFAPQFVAIQDTLTEDIKVNKDEWNKETFAKIFEKNLKKSLH